MDFKLYLLSLFNEIDLNCYVSLPLSNDKLLYLKLYFSFFLSFISNTSIVSINFRANLDSECRKWHFRASNFNNFLGEDALPIYLRCRPHTWPWSLLSPSNILSHRKVPFHKIPPPHRKILKKGPAALC